MMPLNPELNELPQTVKDNIQKQQDAKTAPQATDALAELLKNISSDQGHYIPWEKVQLPSKGQYYDGKIPDGMIEVKPFSIDVDKMTTNQRLIASGELLNKIVEACVRFPDPTFSVYDMLSGDQHFLLYYLRGITHGPIYEFVVKCPVCEARGVYEYDLGELAKVIHGPDPAYPDEPMRVPLPALSKSQGKQVSALIHLVRVRDIVKMNNAGNVAIHDPLHKAKARTKGQAAPEGKQKADSDKAYLDGMKLQIDGFEIGDQTFNDNRRNILIEKLHQRDTATIRDFIDKVSPGIDTTLEVTCQSKDCGKEYTVPLPFGENFFRSTQP